MAATLHQILTEWDGKDTKFLERLFQDETGNPAFLKSLVTLAGQESSQRGATWLLKHHFDSGGSALSKPLTQEHLSCIAEIDDWQAELHVLQYLDRLDIPADAEQTLHGFIEKTVKSEQKFVRAWAWYGLAVLASRFPDRRTDVIARLTEAQATETAGSVKVRIRKALALMAV